MIRFLPPVALCLSLLLSVAPLAAGTKLSLTLSYQQETSAGSGRFHRLTKQEDWQPAESAIIVCDVWDLHHCLNAVRRVEEFAPRLDAVLQEARRRGVTIIHAPSGCMDAYLQHPARRRAMETPRAASLPDQIDAWCYSIPAEERGTYPLDQTDGGEDDDLLEHAAWAKELEARGRDPRAPWKSQSDLITIDESGDYITDQGAEVWSILEARGIRNVILAGVHTNMCVLGRPFGLRQLARNGRHVVLMRDMTDTMYNPQRWPYVSHFTGTDLIVSHIEKYVCPTITSDQLIGGSPFRFAGDHRSSLVMLIAEDEYRTEESLPRFAATQLGNDFRVSFVFGSETDRNDVPGIEQIQEADVLLVSVRRRTLPDAALQRIRDYVASGRPVVGLRTASHAFSLRGGSPPAGCSEWTQFDAEVFGGNYHGHHGNDLKSEVTVVAPDHPIFAGLSTKQFPQYGSLYQTSPLAAGTEVLMTGRVEGQAEEPVTWVYRRADGGRSFYTSMGHIDDFENPDFARLLHNGLRWVAAP